MPLRALLFDFDGLIVDTETAYAEAWTGLHEEAGLRADPAVLHAVVGHVDVAADLWVAFPPEADRAELGRRLTERGRRLCRAAPILPGVVELLAEAARAGVVCAVVSNSSHAHVEGHLEARGLREAFATVVCREDVARGKPAPDPYQRALAVLGCGAEEAVAFEDSVPGHEAAAAAGLRVVVVPNPSTERDEFPRAWRRLCSLAGVRLEELK
jgi:putative hydrolase of the HAD superfamily